MNPQITRLDAATLSRVFDRVTVDALLNMLRVTGNQSDGPTVPQLGEQSDEAIRLIAALRDQLEAISVVIEALQFLPPPIPAVEAKEEAVDLFPLAPIPLQIEHLTTEVRQLAEAVANIDIFLQTEVRQLADQQIVNANLIQEIRQGTML